MSAPVAPANRRFAFPPVVAVLAVAASVDLIANRVLGKLLRVDFLQPRSPFTRLLDGVGLFAHELAAVLAVLALAAGLARVVLFGRGFRAGARVSFPLVGAVFVSLAALGVMVRLPPGIQFHLQLSFLFLALLFALATAASHAGAGVKLGMAFLIGALALRLGPALAAHLHSASHLDAAQAELITGGMVAALGVAGLCFLPRRGSALFAQIVTWPAVVCAAIVIRRDWDTASRVATYAFGVDLPLSTWGQLLCLAAFASALFATLRLLGVPGVHRLRGYGFALLFLSGLDLSAPAPLAILAVALLCIAESAVRVDGRALTRPDFEQAVRNAAASLGAAQVTLSGESGWEAARLHSPDSMISVVLKRRAGVIADLQVTVGETPPRDPPFTVERRGAGTHGAHSSGARVLTEDRPFDRAFSVFDLRGAGAALLDDDTRPRLERLVRGWLGIWPQRGLRYHAFELAGDGEGALTELVTLLRELAARSA